MNHQTALFTGGSSIPGSKSAHGSSGYNFHPRNWMMIALEKAMPIEHVTEDTAPRESVTDT
jgi:hypothetical protein